jgi:hypothetical protein
MNVRFLTAPSELHAQWPDIAGLLDPVVRDAARGEFTLDDLHQLCADGRMIAGTCSDARGVMMAMVFEFRHYPQQMAVNIVALGGRDLHAVSAAFWNTFRAWVKEAGATHIEALCSKPMARLLMRECGFESAYEQVRLPV